MVKNPEDMLLSNLRMLRDSGYKYGIGIDLRELGQCLLMNWQGDHGGNNMHWIVVIAAYETAKLKHTYMAASFQYKESYELLSQIVIPELDEGIGILNTKYVLIIQWSDGFDFLLVPRAECGGHTDRDSWPPGLLVEDVRESDRIVKWNEHSFTRRDIPPPSTCTFQTLPIVHTNAGDLEYLCLLQGRQFHSSSKCILCNGFPEYKHCQHRGDPLTHESLARENRNYKVAHASPDDPVLLCMTADEIKACIDQSKIDVPKTGAKGFKPLFTNIPIENTIPPILHGLLGVGNDTAKYLDHVVEDNESDTPGMVTIRATLSETEQKLVDAKRDVQIWTEHEDSQNPELIHNIKMYDSVAKNANFKKINALVLAGNDLTTSQTIVREKWIQREKDFRQWAPGSVLRVQAETTLISCQVTMYIVLVSFVNIII
jgi:hypothetical protein